ncbi:MAG: T9SS type A sorting domain-containing protein [Salinivirgaceae bacterium]|jgi:hypothetical protein
MQLKHFLILTILLTLSQLVCANELVIEVTTDKYPAETSWTLFNTDKNVVKTNGILQKNYTHRDTLQLDAASCYYWTIYDTYGDGMSNSSGPGDFKIYLDGVLIDTCQNPNFGDSLSIYGIGSNCVDYDISVNALTFLSTQAFNPFELTFNVLNFGSATLTSIELFYDLGGWESETIVLDGLSIEFGQVAHLALPNKLQITTAGTVTVGLIISKINGVDDMNPDNNILTKEVLVMDGYWQKPMHEQFTSSTCSPCSTANTLYINPTLALYPDQYSLIKYQVNWPGVGDPYYTSEVGYMVGQYGVSGAPTLFVDAYGEDVEYSPTDFDSHLGKLTQQFLKIEAKVLGDSVFASVNINTTIGLNGIAYLRFAVVEGITTENEATNGETQFENVFMKFLSNKAGTEVGQLKAGTDTTLYFAASLSETFIEEFTDLKAVAYLFYKNSYKILQSEMIDIPNAPAPPYITFNIQNGAVAVDTLTKVELVSDKKLYATDGSEITDANPLITFKMNDNQGDDVPFNAVINISKTHILVTPTNALNPNTTYYVSLSGVQSQEGVEATKATIIFTTEEAVGACENPFSGIQVFPNPVTDELKINSNTPVEISITDITGRKVFTNFIMNGNTRLDFSGFASGFYLVQVTVNNENKIYKIAKR